MELQLTTETETQTENKKLEFKPNTDICQQLMDRYTTSSAPQHRHLVATAAAMRSILTSESLPLIPSAYFAAAISNLESAMLDSTEISALLTFLSIVVAVVPPKGISESKASEATGVLVGLLEKEELLGVASLKCVVKCLGALLVGFCNLEDWESVKLCFETLLIFSVDKRPKVRRCAQDCLEKVFKSFQSSTSIKSASKLIDSSFKKYISFAVTSSIMIKDGLDDETSTKPEHLEVLHMLNVLKLTIPYLSAKVSLRVLSELCKLMTSEDSPLTRHIFKCIEAFFEASTIEVSILEVENIIVSLASYVSLKERNPMDTVMSAVFLLKSALVKLYNMEARSSWIKNFPVVFGAVAGLLTSEGNTSSHASCILKGLISQLTAKNLSLEDRSLGSEEANAIKSMCAIIDNALSSYDGIPNDHILAVISVLFLKLGESSYIYMNSILLKLADMMNLATVNMPSTNHLQHCIGSAVIAMGPERILKLLPISLDADNFTCTNIWLVPIFKNHVVEASLGFYMEHIVPLAKMLQRASRKVKKSVIGQDLQAHAQALWGLLPAFCRYPIDTHQMFEPLAKLLITFLKKDSTMHENIAVALQVLVNQNCSVFSSKNDIGDSSINDTKDSILEIRRVPSYTKKTATKNIRALASCSTDLLQALVDLFIDSRQKCLYLKDAIGCLASITDSSVVKYIFMTLLKRFHLVNDKGEFVNLDCHINNALYKEQEDVSTSEKDLQRSVIMDLAASFVQGANVDLVDLIYNFIRHTFQASDVTGHHEAYHTLGQVLEKHAWFCASRYEELIDLLLGLKSPADVASLTCRFACFHILLVHTLKESLEEENTKAFLILNEIIVTLKEAKEEHRKAAYDVLLSINSSLRETFNVSSDTYYRKLVNMILGYLSGSSPHIKSGAVSALSVLVHHNPDICLSMPNLVSSLLSLLQSKAVEVIKAVLGFVKVIVSCLQVKDMQNLLSDIINDVLPWSSVSRNHFRSKVTVILEIMIRKCSFAAVESVTPEKYRRFVKTVLENRHGKSSTNEADIGPESVTKDSAGKGKRKEMSTKAEESGATEYRKRKRENKHNSGLSKPHISTGANGFRSAKRDRNFNHKKPMKDQSKGGWKNKKIFNKGSLGHGKRKMEPEMKGRKGAAAWISVSDPKFSKNKKFEKK